MIDKKLFSLLGEEKKYIRSITILSVISLIINIIITAIFCFILYLSLSDKLDLALFFILVFSILFGVIIKYVITLENEKYKNKIGNSIKHNLRQRAYKKTLDLGLNYEKSKVSLMQMSIEGIEQLETYFTMYTPKFYYALIAPIMLFSVLVFIEYKTALVLLFCLPLIPIAIMIVRLKAKKIFAKYWKVYESMGDKFLDNIQGMMEIKTFSAEADKGLEAKKSAEEFRKVTMKVLVMQLSSIVIMDFVAFGGAALAIIFALTSAQNEQILPITALFMILISAEFFLPMRSLGSAFHAAMNGATAGHNLLNFFSLENKNSGTTQVSNVKKITITNGSFAYENPVLKNINMEFIKGITSIVGKSGSGKSTIVNLLTGAFSLDQGVIKVNGLNLCEVDLNSYYKELAVITNQNHIFNQSIRDNFLLFKDNATDKEMFESLEQVNLKNFVLDIGGLDYTILEDSQNISVGQRQRLALAINLITSKNVYIFDEATNNIDIDSEKIILAKIKDLAKTKIVILISHRLNNLVDSNNIYLIENKKIQEQGTHLELLNNKMCYYKLFSEQQLLEKGHLVNDDA